MRNFLSIKVKGQALQLALMVTVIVAILLGTFIMLTHTHSFFRIKSNEVIGLSNKTINTLLTEIRNDVTVLNDTVIIKQGMLKQKKVVSYYGAWQKIAITSNLRKKKIANVALMGSKKESKHPNLYIAGNKQPLVVVGRTRLEGNTYIAKGGIRAGNIGGDYYQGAQLYYGQQYKSKEKLPGLKKDWIVYLKKKLAPLESNDGNITVLTKEIQASFLKPETILYSPETIVLGEEKLTGNIIIKSERKIIVYPTAKLQDVTLVAPEIELKKGVNGNMHLIASKEIRIGKATRLKYPSSVIMYEKGSKKKQPLEQLQSKEIIPVIIEEEAIIEGAIVYVEGEGNQKERLKTHIRIAEKVEIIGELYCEGTTDFRGTIYGSLYTKQFITKEKGSIYINHLYNGKILKNPIETYSELPFTTSDNTLARWMY